MYKQDLICCFCRTEFTISSLPRMVPFCEHSGCTPCLKQLMNDKISHIICQHCGHQQVVQEWDLESFPKNIALIKLIKQKDTPLRLQNDNQASQKNTVDNDQSPFKEKEICQIHQKQLQIICLTDKERICAHCAIFGRHKDHNFKTVREATDLMNQREDEFNRFRMRRQALDVKINSRQFKQDIIKRVANQKDALVSQIKDKFAQMSENLRLAEKKAYQDVIKSFKTISHKITTLINEESDSHKKYQQWQQKCTQFFLQANRSSRIEQKVAYYFGGPLEMWSEGETLLKRIEAKVETNISAIDGLISRIKIVESGATIKSVFNYITVLADDSLQSIQLGHVPQQILSPKSIRSQDSKRNTIQFSPNMLATPFKNSIFKQNYSNNYQKNTSYKNDSQKKNVQKIVQQFCNRDNVDTLDLTGHWLNDADICQVLKCIKPFKKIKGLKLIRNKLTNAGFSKIMDYIPSVTNLNLAFNQLNDEALTVLLENRSKISLLRIINISNNKINDRKVKTTIEQLKKKGLIVTI